MQLQSILNRFMLIAELQMALQNLIKSRLNQKRLSLFKFFKIELVLRRAIKVQFHCSNQLDWLSSLIVGAFLYSANTPTNAIEGTISSLVICFVQFVRPNKLKIENAFLWKRGGGTYIRRSKTFASIIAAAFPFRSATYSRPLMIFCANLLTDHDISLLCAIYEDFRPFYTSHCSMPRSGIVL